MLCLRLYELILNVAQDDMLAEQLCYRKDDMMLLFP